VHELPIALGWTLPASDLQIRAVRSSGPGGQNVNKVATKVELRLFLAQTHALTEAQKRRLRDRYPAHVTKDGDFLLSSDRFRSQARNQQDALERLAAMLLSIRRPPLPRKRTRPTRASKQRRLATKQRRSDIKRQRSYRPE